MAAKKSSMNPTTMAEIARLLVDCSDGEKCVVHYLMDKLVGEDPFLRFHWLLTKAGQRGCMPTDRRLWRELLAVEKEQ